MVQSLLLQLMIFCGETILLVSLLNEIRVEYINNIVISAKFGLLHPIFFLVFMMCCVKRLSAYDVVLILSFMHDESNLTHFSSIFNAIGAYMILKIFLRKEEEVTK